MKSPKIHRVLVDAEYRPRKVFPGGGLRELRHRRRDRLETYLVPKKTMKCGQKMSCRVRRKGFTRYIVRYSYEILVRTNTAHRWRSSKKTLGHRTRKNKSNHLEPHFILKLQQ